MLLSLQLMVIFSMSLRSCYSELRLIHQFKLLKINRALPRTLNCTIAVLDAQLWAIIYLLQSVQWNNAGVAYPHINLTNTIIYWPFEWGTPIGFDEKPVPGWDGAAGTTEISLHAAIRSFMKMYREKVCDVTFLLYQRLSM